jgi:ATP-dependent Clp protease adaptor protein ClpS
LSDTAVTDRPIVETASDERLEDMCQVVLHNDDWNTADHVVRCLVHVFGHSRQLARRIMLEAHATGRAVAEVEGETQAKLHRDQLQSHGLSATVEKL